MRTAAPRTSRTAGGRSLDSGPLSPSPTSKNISSSRFDGRSSFSCVQADVVVVQRPHGVGVRERSRSGWLGEWVGG